MTQSFDRLPEPDSFGNYWFGKPGHPCGIIEIKHERDKNRGKYAVLSSNGYLFDENNKFQSFDTPQKARKFLNQVES